MTKKVIGRIFRVINILINLAIGYIMFVDAISFGMNRTMYSDDVNRLPWLFWGVVIVNVIDYFIRKHIREF